MTTYKLEFMVGLSLDTTMKDHVLGDIKHKICTRLCKVLKEEIEEIEQEVSEGQCTFGSVFFNYTKVA